MGNRGSTNGDSGIFLFFGGPPTRLSKEQIQVLDMYMPDFRIYELSTEAHAQTAATHWNTVFREVPSSRSTQSSAGSTGRHDSSNSINKTASTSRIGVLYDSFYQYLTTHSPELMPVFRSSMQVRSRVLLHISAGMRSVLASEHVLDKTLALTTTHLRCGVQLEYFNALGKALLHALCVASDDTWTPEIEDAWRRLFIHCSAILLVHHKKANDHKQLESNQDDAAMELGSTMPALGQPLK